MSTILRSLQRLLRLFERNDVSYMIIGGYALPFYGRIRTTLDLDIAVAVKTEQQADQLCKWLKTINIEITNYSPNNPLMIIVDHKEQVETELWLKPDGITLDNETLKRRKKATLDKDITAWIIGPEDYIINKLARPDRGAVDEQDVKSVLVRQTDRLDTKYLTRRAQQTRVLTILQTIQTT